MVPQNPAAPVAATTPTTATATAPTEAPAIEVAATVTSTGPAPAPTNGALVPHVAQPVAKPTFYDDDNVNAEDIVVPRFNIVQKVGDLSTQYPGGTLLYDTKLVLAVGGNAQELSAPIRVLVLGFQPTKFVEKLEGGAKGNTFNTEAEVAAAGGTLDYSEAEATDKQLYLRLATAMLLIEQPVGPNGTPLEASNFPLEFNGKNYGLALYSMKGTSYTNAAKHFKSARKIGVLRNTGYRGCWWTLQSQLKKFGSNYAYIPVVKPADTTSPEFRAWTKEVLGF